jgi:hypothetical protein
MESEERTDEDVQNSTITVNLAGIKRMKTNHIWRLEFDVYEQDGNKVAALVDQIEKDFHLLLVPVGIDNKPENV